MESLIEYSKVEVMRNEHVALRDVDFAVAPGEFVYLLGRVGSGKTSLMKTIYAEVPVRQGAARVFDYDLTQIRPHDIPFLRRKIGIVFQDFQLLPDRTAFSNLDFVLQATGWRDKTEREARIDTVLRQVGMATNAFKMPHQLSGGEQQRVALARALVANPSLIIADEPTGNIDPDLSFEIVDLLSEINKCGTTVVMVTHEHTLVNEFNHRVVTIDEGQVVSDDRLDGWYYIE